MKPTIALREINPLKLDDTIITQLALEAEIRGMKIGELIAALIVSIATNNLFTLLRDGTDSTRLGATE